jgi:hypothetical protein
MPAEPREKKHAAPIIAQQSRITEAACMTSLFLPGKRFFRKRRVDQAAA